jgi:hypothetical protein
MRFRKVTSAARKSSDEGIRQLVEAGPEGGDANVQQIVAD